MRMTDESAPDWRLLAPHRPLIPTGASYVFRPSDGGAGIAALVTAGGGPVLVEGPIGVGKSTEVARAAELLATTHVACLIQVDRMANVPHLSTAELLGLITQRLMTDARDKLHIQLPRRLRDAADYQTAARSAAEGLFFTGSPSTGRTTLEAIAHTSREGRIVLLIDGLEKLQPGAAIIEALGTLTQMPDLIDIVAVVSPRNAVFGSGFETVLCPEGRWHCMRSLDLEASMGGGTADVFLRELITRRLPRGAMPPAMTLLLSYAARKSGGIPRTFLQLVAAAGTLARLQRGASWPDVSDMQVAISSQESSFQRALLPGDAAAILAAVGTAGNRLEIAGGTAMSRLEIERRERLLAQGILLERIRDKTSVLEVHPLAASAISAQPAGRGPNA